MNILIPTSMHGFGARGGVRSTICPISAAVSPPRAPLPKRRSPLQGLALAGCLALMLLAFPSELEAIQRCDSVTVYVHNNSDKLVIISPEMRCGFLPASHPQAGNPFYYYLSAQFTTFQPNTTATF
jgi:hypothetical protein